MSMPGPGHRVLEAPHGAPDATRRVVDRSALRQPGDGPVTLPGRLDRDAADGVS